jgi:putative thioredoxin
MTAFSTDASLADFQAKVIDASHTAPVLVDFWAEWCNPCRTLKPLLEKLAADYGRRFLLVKVNSDENQELAARYGVRGIPNVKAFVGGQMVDEFTGVLPEAQLRSFIDRLIPSPSEPLRLAAAEARAKGDSEVALSLLGDALQADPTAEAVQFDLADLHLDQKNIAAAQSILDALEFKTKDAARMKVLQARLKIVTAGGDADPAELRARIDANAADFDARLRLANALALAHDYRAACEQLMEIVRRDRHWQDQAARKTLLDLFALLGGDARFDDLVREFRVMLARTLN